MFSNYYLSTKQLKLWPTEKEEGKKEDSNLTIKCVEDLGVKENELQSM